MFELPTSAAVDPADKHGVSGRHRGRRLFGDDVTHNQLLGMVLDGWRTKTTGLTEAFGFDEYRSQYQHGCVPLFALDPSDRLWLFTAEDSWQPEAGVSSQKQDCSPPDNQLQPQSCSLEQRQKNLPMRETRPR